MKNGLMIVGLIASFCSFGQEWEVVNHANNGRKAIQNNGEAISDYVYSEVSELSEGRSYVAKGELYAYIDSQGNELTPYVFVEASNFTNGYALVGDTFNRSILNNRMQVILPFKFAQVRLPQLGLIVVQGQAGNWGVYDTLGIEKLPMIYDLPPIILSRERIIVRANQEYGVVNDCNEVLWNTAYQYISKDGYAYKSGKYVKIF